MKQSGLINFIQRDTIFDDIIALSNSGKNKFVLYGASDCAVLINNKLRELNINIDFVVVDDSFFSDEAQYFMGHRVRKMESLKGEENLNWIIGFYNDDLVKTVDKKMSLVKDMGIDVTNVLTIDYALLVRPWRRFSYEYMKSNEREFQQTYEMLEDELSRQTMISFINQRINGAIGPLDSVKVTDQYFPEIIDLSEEELFVDCGAYNGDSILAFIKALESRNFETYKSIIAFEPDSKRIRELKQNCREVKSINLIKKGAWSSSKVLRFEVNDELSSEISQEGTSEVEVTSIDEVAHNSPVTFIKMDIQGAEAEALKGAENTIKSHRPTLAICAYHEHSDLINLPRIIKSFNSEYKLYLRAHKSKSNELVLYAVNPK